MNTKKILKGAGKFLLAFLIGRTISMGRVSLDFSKMRAQKWLNAPAEAVKVKKPKKRYAVLIKGNDFSPFFPKAGNKNMAYAYNALKKIGYNDEDMEVFSLDEIKLNGKNIVDYKANKKEIRNVFSNLADKVESGDSLFVFFTGHGGEGGLLQLKYQNISKVELEDMLSKINPLYSITFIKSCYSGDVVHGIEKENNVAISTSKRGKPSLIHTKFAKFFFSAISGNMEADYNKDSKVSLEEAFDYAADNDSCCKSEKSLVKYLFRKYTFRHKQTPQLVSQDINPAELYFENRAGRKEKAKEEKTKK